jgi:hypothetical protein
MAPNQLLPGPEWATQRIERKADLGKIPRVFQPPGTAGKDGDRMTCIFCALTKAAVVTRARAHVAVNCVGVMGITPCPGPKQNTEEDDAVFAARNAQFVAARAACLAVVAAARAAAALAAESAALNKLTSPAGARLAPTSGTARPQKQLKLDATAALGLAATESLARGWLAAGLPFNVLNNPFIRQGLRAVRQLRPSPLAVARASPAAPLSQVAMAGAAWEPPRPREMGGRLLKAEEKHVKEPSGSWLSHWAWRRRGGCATSLHTHIPCSPRRRRLACRPAAQRLRRRPGRVRLPVRAVRANPVVRL